jgi:hypothetical protein
LLIFSIIGKEFISNDKGEEQLKVNDEALSNCTPGIVLTDNDLTNIDILLKYFDKSIHYLCYFHVKKYFKTLVNEHIERKDKQSVLDIMTKLIESQNNDIFEKT